MTRIRRKLPVYLHNELCRCDSSGDDNDNIEQVIDNSDDDNDKIKQVIDCLSYIFIVSEYKDYTFDYDDMAG